MKQFNRLDSNRWVRLFLLCTALFGAVFAAAPTLPPLPPLAPLPETGRATDNSGHCVIALFPPYFRVPNWAHPDMAGDHPIIHSVKDGLWSDPTVWSGTITTDAVVDVKNAVMYDVDQATVSAIVVEPEASLRWATDRNTTLKVQTIEVMERGTFEIGAATQPVDPNYTAQIIFRDIPINSTDSKAPYYDPMYAGNGLLNFGRVIVHGAQKSPTFVRVRDELTAGTTSIVVTEPVNGWKVGDEIGIPDSRALGDAERWAGYKPQFESVFIQSISADNLTITLTAPLAHVHPGARDNNGHLDFTPHLGNVTRNVVFTSENPNGTRGTVKHIYRTEVDMENAEFRDLGRTTGMTQSWDRTLSARDAQGNIADPWDATNHIGKNMCGVPPVMFLQVIGPVNPSDTGYQFKFIGNSIHQNITMYGDSVWGGLTLLGSYYGLIKDNVLYNLYGGAIDLWKPYTCKNTLIHNFAFVVRATNRQRNNMMDAGEIFWFENPDNIVRDNVAANGWTTCQDIVAGVGFKYLMPSPAAIGSSVTVPLHRGMDMFLGKNGVDFTTVTPGYTPLKDGNFLNNEAYGAMPTGFTVWQLGTSGYDNPDSMPQSVIRNFKAWNLKDDAIFLYQVNNILIDSLIQRGGNQDNYGWGSDGFQSSDYWNSDVTVRHADIQGPGVGLNGPSNSPGTFRIEDSYIACWSANIVWQGLSTFGTFAFEPARRLILDNVRFGFAPRGTIHIGGQAPAYKNIMMSFVHQGYNGDAKQMDEVLVYNYNGNPNDNFRVYYPEQHADSTAWCPERNVCSIGAPECGLTNEQCWAKYGIANAGAVAPRNATQRSDIVGLIEPISGPAPSADIKAPKITVTAVPDGVVGQPYNYQLGASGQSVNMRVEFLPDGLTFDSTTGVISGTPKYAMTRDIKILAKNEGGFDEKVVELTVHPAISDPDPSLVGWWKLDEGSGIWVNDASFQANTGKIHGQINWTIQKKNNEGFTFVNSSYIQTSRTVIAKGAITEALWFKTTTDSGGMLMHCGQVCCSGDRLLYMSADGRICFANYFYPVPKIIRSVKSYNDGNWHHAAATISNTGATLYIDGVPVASSDSVNSATVSDGGGNWLFGCFGWMQNWTNEVQNHANFNGSIADVRVYSRALSSSQITQLINGQITADSGFVKVGFNQPRVILLSVFPYKEGLSYHIINQPSHGTLSGTAPVLTYTPNNNYSGPDSFSFNASDGTQTSNTAMISVSVLPTSFATVNFLNYDAVTQGTWKGNYGTEGSVVIGNLPANLPSTITVGAAAGKADYTWSSSTNDIRALQTQNGSTRIASCWYGNSSFDVAVNLKDGASHKVALYFLDWSPGGRTEKIDVLDSASSEVLDARTISNFDKGLYLVWNIKGSVIFRFTNIGGQAAIVNGVFFGVSDNFTGIKVPLYHSTKSIRQTNGNNNPASDQFSQPSIIPKKYIGKASEEAWNAGEHSIGDIAISENQPTEDRNRKAKTPGVISTTISEASNPDLPGSAFISPDMHWNSAGKFSRIADIQSSSFSGKNSPSRVLDNDLRTWWKPQKGGKQWLCFDLGKIKSISGVTFAWYTQKKTSGLFTIEISEDNKSFTAVKTGRFQGNGSSEERFTFDKQLTRYVRITFDLPKKRSGFSVYEAGITNDKPELKEALKQ